jgi:flagellar export protein FliJ
MNNFKFKFEPVKKVKEALEKIAQKEIAVINQEINDKNDEINNIVERKRKNKLMDIVTISVGDLMFNRAYQNQLDNEIEENLKIIEDLNVKKSKKTEELIARAKEKRIFMTLEEIHKDIFIKEENTEDIKVINEIAIQKFARKEHEG